MTTANKAGSPGVAGNRRKGSSATIAVAGFAMLMTLMAGTARNSNARRDPGILSTDLKMSVRVYNYAPNSTDMLRVAESETEKIFAKAGVRLEWHECAKPAPAQSADPACAAPVTPTDLRLRIVNRVQLKDSHASAPASGFTFGDFIIVQLEHLRELPAPAACFRDVLLGRVIAHEMGHVLLGEAHSPQGIMQARWGEEQLDLKAISEMLFTPDQTRALRLAVQARTRL